MLRDEPADPASSSSAYDGVSLYVGDWQSISVGWQGEALRGSGTVRDSNSRGEVMDGESASIAHCN
jgi:hypothetical protein